MGFIGSSSTRELDAQAELQQPPTDEIDYEIDIDYELELELAAEESESDSDFEDDAPAPTDAIPATRHPTSSSFSSVNKHDLRSPTVASKPTYNNNDVSESNDRLSAALPPQLHRDYQPHPLHNYIVDYINNFIII